MKRKLLPFLMLTLVMLCGCAAHDLQPDANYSKSYVQMVKDGTNTTYPERSYGEAFNDFFASPDWKYFQADSGEDIVEFSGDCTYRDVEVTAILQFILDVENGTFEVGALSFNDVPQANLVTAALLEKAFEHSQELPNSESVANNDAESKSNVSVAELFGETTAQVISQLGNKYSLESIEGTQILFYEDLGYLFYFIPSEWGAVDGSEIITIISAQGDAMVTDVWRCGMTEAEIETATNADNLLDRYFSTDEIDGTLYLLLETEQATFTFEWWNGDSKTPCDLVTIS